MGPGTISGNNGSMMAVAPASCFAQLKGTSSHLWLSRRPQRSALLQTIPFRARRHGEAVRCKAADGASKRSKSGRQQSRDAADAAQRGIDDAATNAKSGIQAGEDAVEDAADNVGSGADLLQEALDNRDQALSESAGEDAVENAADSVGSGADLLQEALDNRDQALSEPAADARSSTNDTRANLKDAVQSAEETAGSQRKSVRGTSESVQEGIDSVADSIESASRQAQRYAAEPEQAVDDAAEAANQGIDSAAEAVSEGIDQAREYAEDPKEAVSDAAGAAEEGVDAVAENLKGAVRAVQQGVTDAADAAEEAAEDAQGQGDPRIGSRPVSVSYSSGAGTMGQDTSTSGGSTAQQATGEAIEDTARQLDQGADEVADSAVSNIDEAAEQARGIIGAAQERIEGAFDEAPRQAASVVQQAVDSTADTIKQVKSGVEQMRTPPAAAPFSGTPLTSLPSTAADGENVDFLKTRLLYSVAGLDRGFAANAAAELAVETAIYSLVGAAGGSPPLDWTARDESKGTDSSSMAQLNGTWRLVYSSGFASGSLGGLRPGPPAALVPITIGQVYQVISTGTATLDNVVEFYARYNTPTLPGMPENEPIVTTLRLRHSLEVLGNSTVQITFEDTEVKATGGLGGVLGRLPGVTLPQLPGPLKPSRALRSSTFEVIYLDADLRITRGDRGELRVFVRST